jgi:hypothetical protein
MLKLVNGGARVAPRCRGSNANIFQPGKSGVILKTENQKAKINKALGQALR